MQTQQGEQNESLVQQLSRLSVDLSSCQIPVSYQLKTEINKVIAGNEEQHIITRQHAKTHIVAAVQDLKSSQDQHRSEQRQEQRSQQEREQFLGSSTFDEINKRMNEVSLSHPKTFEWIFDDNIKRPWDSFATWLKGDELVYWINGKAGSGKGTLMKFIAHDSRTKSLLAQRYPNIDVLILTFYFWLSGSRKQRTLKGLLCSLIRQIMLSNESLFEKTIYGDETLLTKRSIDDWSNHELQRLLMTKLLLRPICVFIDGLDELDPGENIDNLWSLIDQLSATSNVKICVSSRPEISFVKRLSQHKKIRLQDLTLKDMEICIRDELERLRAKCPPASLDQQHFDKIVRLMLNKADGVFLWVYYALSSLIRGMRNEDGFKDLLDRIEELPSEMQQLYLQMWNVLTGMEIAIVMRQ